MLTDFSIKPFMFFVLLPNVNNEVLLVFICDIVESNYLGHNFRFWPLNIVLFNALSLRINNYRSFRLPKQISGNLALKTIFLLSVSSSEVNVQRRMNTPLHRGAQTETVQQFSHIDLAKEAK